MILPKYYCEKCKKFKTRREVEMGFVTYWEHVKVLRCKGCHEPIIGTSKSALEEVMKDYFVWKEEKRKQREIKLRTEHSR